MSEVWLRIILAALISTAGMLATYGWSKSFPTAGSRSGPEPVARITLSANDVERRPSQSLSWYGVLRNQELFPGEAVRTSAAAEAKIEFIHQGTVVQLDPETVIEIERTATGINLDFLKGNLFIKSQSTAGTGPAITIMSGDEKIDVTNSEVSIAKSAPSAKLDVDVIKGDVRVIERGQSKGVIPSKPRIKLTKPVQGRPLYVRSGVGEAVSFEWLPIDSGYEISLETGPSRSQLMKHGGQQGGVARGSDGRLLVSGFTPGKIYYRIVARSERPGLPLLESPVLKAEIREKIPPLLLEPAPNVAVQLRTGEQRDGGQDGRREDLKENLKDVTFRWANPGRLVDMVIEAARSPDLRTSLRTKSAGDQLSVSLNVLDQPGRVYWRVSGRLPGTNQLISSPIQQFELFTKEKGPEPLLAPVLRGPADTMSFALLRVRTEGVRLAWTSVKGANRYDLTLTEEGGEPKSFKRETHAPEMTVKNLKPGSYAWAVAARDEFGRLSPDSEVRRFVVEGVPVLAWMDGLIAEKFIYKTEKPYLRAAWERGPGSPVSWRYRISGSRQPASDQDWKLVKSTAMESPLLEPGTYRVEVEALAGDGSVLARTQVRTVEVSQAPPLPPPVFGDGVPIEIQAKENGSAAFAWKPVPEARQYVMTLKGRDGSTVRTVKTEATRTEVGGVRTGEYRVVLQTVDALGRTGPESAPRVLKVPEYSLVRAPKIKSINVK